MPAIHSAYEIQYGLPRSRAAATDCSVSASASSTRPADWSPSTYDARPYPRVGAVAPDHLAGQLDVALEVAAVDLAEGLDEHRVARLARVVAAGVLELGGAMGVLASGVGPAGEAGVAGGGVEAGQTRHVGGRCGVDQLLGPRQGLEELHREAHQRGVGGDVGRHLDVVAARRPAERRAQVAELDLDPVDRLAPAGPVPVVPVRRRLLREERRMPVTRGLGVAGVRQPVDGELADRLEHAVARARRRVVGDDERLPHERIERLQHVDLVAARGDGADAREIEPAGEHRDRPQQRPLALAQQVVGPLDGVTQA